MSSLITEATFFIGLAESRILCIYCKETHGVLSLMEAKATEETVNDKNIREPEGRVLWNSIWQTVRSHVA